MGARNGTCALTERIETNCARMAASRSQPYARSHTAIRAGQERL